MSSGAVTTVDGRRCTVVRKSGLNPSVFPLLSTLTTSPTPPNGADMSSISSTPGVPMTDVPSAQPTKSTGSTDVGNSNDEGPMGQGSMMITIITVTVTSVTAILILLLAFTCVRVRYRRQARALTLKGHTPSQSAEKAKPSQPEIAHIQHTPPPPAAAPPTNNVYRDVPVDNDGIAPLSDDVQVPHRAQQSKCLLKTTPGAGAVVGAQQQATSGGPQSRLMTKYIQPRSSIALRSRAGKSPGTARQKKNWFSRLFAAHHTILSTRHTQTPPDPSASAHRRRVDSIIPSPNLHFLSDSRLATSTSTSTTQSHGSQRSTGPSSSRAPALRTRPSSAATNCDDSVVVLPRSSSTASGNGSVAFVPDRPLRLTASDLSRWRRARRRSDDASSSSSFSSSSVAPRKSDPFDLDKSYPAVADDAGGVMGSSSGDVRSAGADANDKVDDDYGSGSEAILSPNGVRVAVAVQISRPQQSLRY